MKLALHCVGAALVLAGCATAPGEADHAAHHPPAGAPASGAPTPGDRAAMMKSMHETHARMRAAATPEERARLMQEHLKLMQQGMATMGRMHDAQGRMGLRGGKPMDPATQGQCIEMMDLMMQTMRDREATLPPASR